MWPGLPCFILRSYFQNGAEAADLVDLSKVYYKVMSLSWMIGEWDISYGSLHTFAASLWHIRTPELLLNKSVPINFVYSGVRGMFIGTSPTLVGLHCKMRVYVGLLVCLLMCGHIPNGYEGKRTFQIAYVLKL